MMMEALNSSETSILASATLHNTPEDAILRCGNVFPYFPIGTLFLSENFGILKVGDLSVVSDSKLG
jgi:hypothetical protein